MSLALDAITRLDLGVALPGDDVIAAIFDAHCDWEEQRLNDRLRQIEHADWLASQCPTCEPGGGGEPCELHEAEPICAHCGLVQQGLAVLDGQLLCHTDDRDCWTRVTVLRHQMPCGECADGGEGGSRR